MASETAPPDNDDVKKKAFLRLAIAGVVTATALAGLWWLDQGQSRPDTASQTQDKPAPIRAARETAPVPAPIEPSISEEDLPPDEETLSGTGSETDAEPGTGGAGPSPAKTGMPAALPPPPPPRVSNRPDSAQGLANPAQPALPRLPLGPATGLPSQPPSSTPASPPTSTPTQPLTLAPAAPISGSVVVQMGVFSAPARAEELVQKLRRQGIQARTETRVYVGPFPDRLSAEKAQAEMRKHGMDGLITKVAPTK